MSYHVCRLCHQDARHYEVVKYSTRHYAHFACYLDSGKPLAKLKTHQLEGFPWRVIYERGLGDEFDTLLANRQLALVKQERDRNG